ncbi:uncharacterized protein MELLADRAFT_102366 [Melampsora larici-populina 98AG31]|uniref:MRG domain-containing protein n=1 Tax=Melampsora larici-populina (strain 98AG31 / pathotype 3-4-7) TaxID=747676 RepID=F4R820_MELLP|nr:uncharacterized protein MELLADRAFT_102366 [Melampsora larici-populina 98AG31]EGG11418.1 hypothetical protein MELLADRAFT_102366 [Melampsora larici-populina 98AG31]
MVKLAFADNECVLCYRGPLIYEAKHKLGIGSSLDKGKKPEQRGTKKSRDIGIETEEEPSKRPIIRIMILEPLKLQQVDNWEAVRWKNQVVTLPRNLTVSMIFQEYETYESKSKTLSISKNLLHEVLAGIKVYFDKALGHYLLYRYL